jgi:murein DD-endopeptidase MepM/ murein hydrolase activator NlpD
LLFASERVRPGNGRRGRAKTGYALIATLAAVALAPTQSALAASGGATLPPPEKVKKQSAAAPGPVRQAWLADVRCAANLGGPCLDAHRAERGATIQLKGRNLAAAKQVVFYGAKGAADDTFAPVQSAQAKSAIASIPAQALSGPIAVIDAAGKRSHRWQGLLVDIPQSFSFRPATALPGVEVGLLQPRTIFFDGMQRAIFSFKVTGTRPVDVEVDLVRLADNVVVRTWKRMAVAPGVTQRIAWDGAVAGKPQKPGRYAFRATVPGAIGARAAASSDDQDAVNLIGYVFPVRGAHQFNMGAGRFGAARRGHVHQGQDVFARCGTPLVAARGGPVIYAGYHVLAGYYVVIDGKGTGIDFAYMHLRQPALVVTGEAVSTGQQIGEVGDTGDAVGCHLHFEEWTAPGWYKGGHPFDPLPDLKRWDVPAP